MGCNHVGITDLQINHLSLFTVGTDDVKRCIRQTTSGVISQLLSKFAQKKQSPFSKILCLLILRYFAVLAAKWRHEFGTKIWFQCYGISNDTNWKKFLQGSQKWKNGSQKTWTFEVCIFVLYLVTKWRQIQISKHDIFWVDRHISFFFSVFRFFREDLSIDIIRYPIILKPKFGAKFVTKFSLRKNRKNKKHRILENDEIYVAAEFDDNWLKTQEVICLMHLLAWSVPTVIYHSRSVGRTSSDLANSSLKHSTSFRVISPNQELSRALTTTPQCKQSGEQQISWENNFWFGEIFVEALDEVSEVSHPIKNWHERSRVLRKQ